jgi:predicted CopG family antitoxin
MGKQVVVSDDVHSRLASLKVHPREPFNDVIKRLLDFYEAKRDKLTAPMTTEHQS